MGMTGLRVSVLALASAAAIAIAGCGSSSSDSGTSSGGSSGSSSGKLTTMKVGIVGLTADAPLYIANEKGWFKEAGLDVQPTTVGSGAASLAAAVGGSNQIGTGNLLSLVQAVAKGLQLQAIAPANEAAVSASDRAHATSAIMVPADSPIKTPADLAGKTIAVNAVKSLGDLTILESLQKKGVDVSGIKFTELGFPDMLTALDSHRVDAIWEVEPFVTAAKAQHARVIDWNFEGTASRLPLGVYYATTKWIGDNKAAAASFSKVIKRANAYANAHPDEVRRVVPTFTKIPAAAAKTMALTVDSQSFSQANIDLIGRLMVKHKLVDELPDLNQIFGPVIAR
jgi:NitT/TauT family transport system substrate-binding protein